MKKILKIFYFVVLLQIFIPSVFAKDYMNVYLSAQGAFQSINIDEIDKITFPSEDEISITISGIVTPMAIEGIEVITFGDTDITAIKETEMETTDIVITYYRGEVRITSHEVINQVQLYNMQGVMIQSLVLGEKVANLNVSNYPSGVYIVAVQSNGEIETKKFIK